MSEEALLRCRFWNERTGTLWFRFRREIPSQREEEQAVILLLESATFGGLKHLHLDLRSNGHVMKLCALVPKFSHLESIKVDLRHCDLQADRVDVILVGQSVGILDVHNVCWIGLEHNPGARELERLLKRRSLRLLEKIDVFERMSLSRLLIEREQKATSDGGERKKEDQWRDIEVTEKGPHMPFSATWLKVMSRHLDGKSREIHLSGQEIITVWSFRRLFLNQLTEMNFVDARLISTLDFSPCLWYCTRQSADNEEGKGWLAFLQEVVAPCRNLECLNLSGYPFLAKDLIHFYRFFLTHAVGRSMLLDGPLKFIVIINPNFSTERVLHETQMGVMLSPWWTSVMDLKSETTNKYGWKLMPQKFVHWDEKKTRQRTDYVLSRDEYYGDTDVRPLNRKERFHVEYHGITFPSYLDQELINPPDDLSSDNES